MFWLVVDQRGLPAAGGPEFVTHDLERLLESLSAGARRDYEHAVGEALRTNESQELTLGNGPGRRVGFEIFPLPVGTGRTTREQALVAVRTHLSSGGPNRPLEAAARNDAILRTAMDGFFIVDESFRFTEVNDAFARMTGYDPAELLGMKISDLEVREPLSGAVASHLRTGLHHFPTAHRHKSGRLIYLEISVNVLRDQGDKILVGFARDVTERRRAEEEFARLSRRHKLILESADEGICCVDRDGDVTFLNPTGARVLGVSAGTLLMQPLHPVLVEGADARKPCPPATDCPLCRALHDGAHCPPREGVFRSPGGVEAAVEFSITPMFERDQAVGAVVLFRDISARKRAEEERRTLEAQMLQAQKLESLGLLAGGIAHDLNNTLVGILGNACLALNQVDEPAGVRDRMQRIISACERASKVIRQILAYSGQATCDAAPLELGETIREMTDFIRAALPKNITLRVDHAEEAITVEADSGQLQQIFTNLIINASEAIGDRAGTIRVAVDSVEFSSTRLQRDFPGQQLEPGRFARLAVTDDGCGMTPETLNRIFEPFFSRKGPGRGLGLAATRGVLRAHGGGIRVESQAGRGTSFSIILPQSVPAQVQPRLTVSNLGAAQDARVVLVVDDDDEVRAITQEILESRGIRVLAAEDGLRGLDLFRQNVDDIDVVVLDATMPGMSGGDVFREIIALRPDARVIVASGYSEENLAQRFEQRRPDAFLSKPFTLKALVDKVNEVIAQPLAGDRNENEANIA